MLVAHVTTYTAALGLIIGLAGSAIAATLYRNLKHARTRLERLAETKLKPSMQKVIEKIPTLEVRTQNPATTTSVTAATLPNQQQETTTSSSGKYTVIPAPSEQGQVSTGMSMPVLPVKQEEPRQS